MSEKHPQNTKGTASLKGGGTFCVLILSWFFLFLASPACAWQIDQYENDVTVHESGITEVLETIHVNFMRESRHGIYRTIPLHAQDAWGQNVKTRLHVRAVTDNDGRNWPYHLAVRGSDLMIRIGDPERTISGKQSYKIFYEVERGALRFFKDHDEFFWNLIGTDWEAPIKENINRIRLPNAAGKVKVIAYRGFYGSTQRVKDIEIRDSQIVIRSQGSLAPREAVTAAVSWNKGVVVPPSIGKKFLWTLEDNGIYAVPMFVFLFMLWLWQQKGRDPEFEKSITVEYAPPVGMTPAEVGTLIDQKADMQDITACLIDLAVRGYLKIEETSKGLFGKGNYHLVSLKPWEGESLKPYEKTILTHVFGQPQRTVKLSDLNEQFYSKLSGIRTKIYSGLIQEKLLDGNPEQIRASFLGIGAVLGACLFFIPRIFISEYYLSTASLILCAVLSGGMVALFGLWMPRRTMKGAAVMNHIRGFSEFLKRADEDRIKRMDDPALFERCLPFAMVLGFADQWAKAFEGIYTQPPDWYVGHGASPHFSSRGFTNDMRRVSSSMNQTFTSVPSSSSSGFSSGGGFSGGGGGGGGGGAW